MPNRPTGAFGELED